MRSYALKPIDRRFIGPTLAFAFAIIFASIPAAAQNDTASFGGRITDPSGAIVADAAITIRNVDTNVEDHTQTNGDGLYLFPGIRPGHYVVTVIRQGFRTVNLTGLTLYTQDKVNQNFSLTIGAVSESVTVEGGAPLVNTETSSVSTVIDRKFVETLPLNGRSFNTLLQLTPGVVIAPSGAEANGSPGQFSIAGQRTDANNFTVDGVSANFGVAPQSGNVGSGTGTSQAFSVIGGTSSLASVEVLQEFRIETSSFAPEFGRSPGGQVILTTRSGTNDLHGGTYDYFRNTVMDASNWFNADHTPPLPRAPEHHNDFGAYLGGPIWRDHTFFFASYEGARLDQPQSAIIEVPSLYARAQASSTLAPFLNAYPQPNGDPASPDAYVAPLAASFSNKATMDAGSLRLDHTINDRFTLFGRYNYAPSTLTDRNVTIPSNPETITVDTQTVTLGANMSLTPRLSNAVRANYSSQKSGSGYSQDTFGGAVPLPPQLLLGSLPAGSSSASFLTFDTFREYIIGAGSQNRSRQLNFVDDFSWSMGTHQLKFGADYRDLFLDSLPYQNQLNFSATSIETFLASGEANVSSQALQHSYFLSQAMSLYGQDTWKLTPKLTFTYGLRWELSPAPTTRDNTKLASWVQTDNISNVALAPSGSGLWQTTVTNFAPRFGLAYSITPNGGLVLRAGGGIFYDLGTGPASQLASSFPNSSFEYFSGAGLPASKAKSYVPPIVLTPPFPSGAEGYSADLKLPRSYQWNLAMEKALGNRETLSLTYVGQAGRELLREEASYQPNPNFAGEFLLWENTAYSNYHALQVQYRRPLAASLQALLNYSWSHSLDNASNDAVAGLSHTVISASSDYASSDFDVRHSFSGALTYDIPSGAISRPVALFTRGWSVDTVIVARSGFPFNALLLTQSPDLGGYVRSRPSLVAGQPEWIANQSAGGGKSLNPSAFIAPSTVRQGTEGRNDISGFGLTQIDLSLARKFALPERFFLEFRADAFNVFNHPNFSNPPGLIGLGPAYLSSGTMLNQSLGGLNPLFQQGGPRSLQLSLKLAF